MSASKLAEAQLLFKNAFEMLQSKEPKSAAIKFEVGLKIDPANVMAQYWAGEAYLLSAQNDLAREHYEFVMALDSKSKEAQLAAERLQSIDPTPYIESGDKKFKNKDFDGSMADYNRAIELNSKSYKAYVGRGLVKLSGQDSCEGPIADYSRAIELNPEYTDAYF